jgi:dethiobiotin synthetase
MNTKKPAFFITGTDTDCGKTEVSAALIRHLKKKYQRVAGMKPIASGFELRDGQWRNRDVDCLLSASNVDLPRTKMNRYAYRPAIAPHIAAASKNQIIDLALIASDVNNIQDQVDALVVEAVGGWLVPLNIDVPPDRAVETIETLANSLAFPVILVVGMKLGCLSHALLTARAIIGSGAPFLGWVANHLDPSFACADDNLEALNRLMPVPKLFELGYRADKQGVSEIIGFSNYWLTVLE